MILVNVGMTQGKHALDGTPDKEHRQEVLAMWFEALD